MAEILGIDVSKWQVNTNWKKVKEAGVKFVMVRAMYGLDTCSLFKKNIEGALSVGLDVGVYVYSLAMNTTQAKKEAQQVLKLIKPYDITYPVVYDLESAEQAKLSIREKTDLVIAFCEEIEKAGYTPMVYSNPNWLKNHLDYKRIKQFDIWLAHYVDKSNYPNPYTMWQKTDKGKIDGVVGNVDIDISYKDYGKETRDMRKKLAQLEKEIANIKKDNEALKKDNAALKKELADLQKSYNTAKTNLANYSKQLSALQNAGLKIETIVNKVIKSPSMTAATKAADEILAIIKSFK